MSEAGDSRTAREIAAATGLAARSVHRRAAREGWPCEAAPGNGGNRILYLLEGLPAEVRAAILRAEAASLAPDSEARPRAGSDALWERAASCSAAQRKRGMDRAAAVRSVRDLVEREGLSVHAAVGRVAPGEGVPARTLRRWHDACQAHAPQDWAAALVPRHGGGPAKAEIHPLAWEYFKRVHLDRSKPRLAMSYRRTQEAADANGWGELPSIDTLRRRLDAEIRPGVQILAREGERKAAELHPPQRRDKSAIRAGQIASGDGCKFDRLFVDWGNGEVINTSTGWFWLDVRTGFVMAHRLAQTETTDLIRLASYDMTEICLPDQVWIDNTRAAANKAMTAGAPGRNRFKDQDGDPEGLFLALGVTPHFTDPDKIFGSPGAKPIERFFGKGGIHEMVATRPGIRSSGHSRKDPISVEEFMEAVAQEVLRWNRQQGRRWGLCAGRSCEQAFQEDFKWAEPRIASAEQRALLMLMPKRAQVLGERGEVTLQMHGTSGRLGRHRYADEELERHMGRDVNLYYDPADMTKPVTVYDLTGHRICLAAWVPDVGFLNSAQASQHGKQKRRSLKAKKQELKAALGMSEIEAAALTPTLEGAEVPQPGVIVPNVSQQLMVVNGGVVDAAPKKAAAGGGEARPVIPLQTDEELRRGLEIHERMLANRRERGR